MAKKRNVVKQIIAYFFSLLLAAFIVNGLLYTNYWHPEKYFVSNYSSNALHRPHSICVEGREGFAILHTDENGYFNEQELNTDGSYILCLGSSDTQAKSIPNNKNYCQMLEQKLSEDGIQTDVYNAGMDGAGLDEVLGHFHASMQKFNTADMVIIEMSWFPEEADLQAAIGDESEYRPFDYASYQESLGIAGKMKNAISAFPLPRVLNNQLTKLSQNKRRIPFVAFMDRRNETVSTDEPEETQVTDAGYQQLLMDAAAKIRREAGKKDVILLFSTATKLESDGTLIDTMDHEKMEWLQEACNGNNIAFINMARTYIDYYNQNHVLYRGFANTSPGSGHLNKTGHALIAEELYNTIDTQQLMH